MKLTNLLIVLSVSIMMTACNENVEDNNSISDYDSQFERVSISDAFLTEFEGESHIKPAEDMVNLTANISEVFTFDVEGSEGDYTTFCDTLGKYYFNDQYDNTAWKISETTTMDGIKTKDAFYSPEGYKGMLHVSDSALFLYQPEGREFAFDLQFVMGTLLKDDSTEYKLSDKSMVTYAEAVKQTDTLIKGFDLADNNGSSKVSQVMYDPEHKVIKVDYLPDVHGLKLSKIRDSIVIDDATTENDVLGIRTSNSFPTKEAYVFASGNDGAFVNIFAYKFKIVNEKSYDKIISLQSAIKYIDKSIAPNMHLEIKKTELKYLLPADEIKEDNGAIRLETHGIPVWEMLLYAPDQHQEYAFVMDALSGKCSFIRLHI